MLNRNLARRLVQRHAVALAAATLAAPAVAVDHLWTSGDFASGVTAPSPLLAGDVLLIQAGGTKRFVGGSFSNQGLVRWQADVLQGGNSATVTNSGLWQTEADTNSLVWAFGGQPVFTNTGTWRKTAGANTNVGTWAFVNQGGLIDAQAGSITFNGDANQFLAGSRFAGAGGVVVSGNSLFGGAFQAELLTLAGGTFTGSAASFSGGVGGGAGHLRWSAGDLAGAWTIGADGRVTGTAAGGKRQLGSTITNHGLFVWDTGSQLQGGNGSVFTNHGSIEARQSAAFNWNYGGAPTYVNTASGTVRATNGATLTFGTGILTSDGGLFTADAGSMVVYTGPNNRFNDGTRFVGDHRVNGVGRFVGAIQSNDLRFVDGTQIGGDGSAGSQAVLQGQVQLQGGDLQGAWRIDAGSTVTGAGATAKRQLGSDIGNHGLFVWDTGSQLQGGNGSVFTNHGSIEVRQSAAFNWNYGSAPAYVNTASGTVRATNNATLTFGTGILTSDGGLFTADAGSMVVYTGANNRFNDGTRFVGDHRINGVGRFVGAIQSNDLRFVDGTQIGGDGSAGSQAVLQGQVQLQGGDLQGAWRIDAGSTVTGAGATAKRQLGSDIGNHGLFVWDTGSQLQGGNGSVFTNHGSIEVRQSAAFNWNYGSAPTYVNTASGTVRATNGATLTFGTGILSSDGGLFTADAGSAIVYAGDNNRFNDGTRFVGDHRVAGSARYVGQVQANGLRWAGGTQTGGDGSPGSFGHLSGAVAWDAGDAQGAFELAAGATLRAGGAAAKRQVGGLLVNHGSIVWDTAASHQTGNSSRLDNHGRYELAQDSSVVWAYGGQGQLVNHGLLIKTGGAGTSALSSLALSNAGTIDVRSGTIALPVNFSNAGTLAGTGSFALAGTLANQGHIAPGASTGTLSIAGALAMGPGGFFDVQLTDLSSHDQLLVSGNVALAGTLALQCLGGCALAVGQELVILDADGQLSGSFAALTLTGFATGAFEVVYDLPLDRVLLRVTENVTAVPEPANAALMAAGLALLGGLAWRRSAPAAFNRRPAGLPGARRG